MIRPPISGGMTFSEASDGDARDDTEIRPRISLECHVANDWATLRQVHGATVHRVEQGGPAGEGDALWTTAADVPVAVFTADCFGVILEAEDAVGVAHAGWRGVVAGVVAKLRQEMSCEGHRPIRAAIGPGIGSCCFEVGDEVADQFPGNITETSWGTVSVDLRSVIERQLDGIETWIANDCTLHDPGWFSHRRDQTQSRFAAVGWI